MSSELRAQNESFPRCFLQFHGWTRKWKEIFVGFHFVPDQLSTQSFARSVGRLGGRVYIIYWPLCAPFKHSCSIICQLLRPVSVSVSNATGDSVHRKCFRNSRFSLCHMLERALIIYCERFVYRKMCCFHLATYGRVGGRL